MNWRLLFTFFMLVAACQENQRKFEKAEDAEDAGREFIRATLDGNYEKAKFYLYNDSADFNIRLLERWKQEYDRMPAEEQKAYKSAAIRPISIENADSVNCAYTYYNSYKKDTTTIRVLKADNAWLVDLRDLH